MKCTVCGKEFDAAPAVNPWVSVKERFPDWNKCGIDYSYLCLADCKLLIDTVDDCNGYDRRAFSTGVTHWWDESIMPIPRPE